MLFTATIKHPNPVFTMWRKKGGPLYSLHSIPFVKKFDVFVSENITLSQVEILKGTGAIISLISSVPTSQPEIVDSPQNIISFKQWADDNGMAYPDAYAKYKKGLINADIFKDDDGYLKVRL